MGKISGKPGTRASGGARGFYGWIAALACVVGGGTLSLSTGLAQPEEPGTIATGVTVDGLSLGGMTRAQAAKSLHDLSERKLLAPIRLQVSSWSGKTTARDLGGQCDTEGVLAAALAAGRSEGLLDRVRERVGMAGAGSEIALPVSFETRELTRRLHRMARRVERRPIEPRVHLAEGQIVATPGRPGRVVDETAAEATLQKRLAEESWRREVAASVTAGVSAPDWAASASPLSVTLALRDAAPRATPEQVRQVQTLLASFSTSFGLRDRNRVHNIRVAAKAIDGLLLLPGDVFSYNATVGPRRSSAGFRTAPEIVQGILVPGIGGGVCQVSSTIYNAALLADLEITRRHHHHFPVHYLPAGRDATVSDGGLDLRFRNRLGAPVALLLSVKGGRILARVYGAESSRRSVRLLTQRLRPAYTRKGGRRVALVRIVEQAGVVIRRETVSRDTYEPPPPSYRSGRTEHRKKPSG